VPSVPFVANRITPHNHCKVHKIQNTNIQTPICALCSICGQSHHSPQSLQSSQNSKHQHPNSNLCPLCHLWPIVTPHNHCKVHKIQNTNTQTPICAFCAICGQSHHSPQSLQSSQNSKHQHPNSNLCLLCHLWPIASLPTIIAKFTKFKTPTPKLQFVPSVPFVANRITPHNHCKVHKIQNTNTQTPICALCAICGQS
jgi:hypothetical protein